MSTLTQVLFDRRLPSEAISSPSQIVAKSPSDQNIEDGGNSQAESKNVLICRKHGVLERFGRQTYGVVLDEQHVTP